MNAVFLKVLNMSMAASWLIGAVLILHLVLKKAPRWVFCLLWAAAAVRLVCPISLESPVSLVPSAEVVPQEVITGHSFEIHTGIEPVDVPVNEYLANEGVAVPADRGVDPLTLAGWGWLAGLVLLGGHAIVSYQRLRRRLATSVRLRDHVYQSENAQSPFVLGFFPARIYLPFGMEPGALVHVLAHEQAHIDRLDHWWKALGYGVLMVHWFNPMVWLGYRVFCRDLELACDERVVRTLDGPGRAEYSEALLRCSLEKRSLAACPLAFGEVGVKERIHSILRYRRPAFWAVAIALAVCIAVGVCFLTDPAPSREFPMAGDHVSDLEPERIVSRILDIEDCEASGNAYINSSNFQIHLKGDFTWDDSQAVQFFFYRDGEVRSAQLRIFPEEQNYFVTESQLWTGQRYVYLLRHYLDALKYLPQAEISALCPGAEGYILHQVHEGSPGDYDRVLTYSADGVGETNGWYVHLQLQPLWDGHGTGADVVELFYGSPFTDGELFCWYDRNTEPVGGLPVKLEAFPNVTFRAPGDSISAVVTDPETGESGESILLSGMPIVDGYFCDVTGDGYPEICTTSYFGSGMIDERVQIYDYAQHQRWELQHRGTWDYRLKADNGRLFVERRAYLHEEEPVTCALTFRDGVLMLEDGTEFLKHFPQFTAEVTGYHGEGLLVRPVLGTPGLSADTEYHIQLEENLLTYRPRVGDTVVASYDGTVQELYPPVLSGADVQYVLRSTLTELRPMLFADGAIYMETGRAVPAEIDESAVMGRITSAVPGDEQPTREGQSNFGCEGSRYARFEDGIVVEIGGEWFYFEPLTLNEEEDP